MSGAPQPADHLWWLVSRASGLVALGLVTLSMGLGLAMAGRLRRGPRPAVLHEHLALAALVAMAVHGISLLGDPWLHPGATGIAIPFALHYRTLFTGLGVIAGYLTAVLALSFYVRRHIGGRTWRSLHRFTTVGYVLAVVHAVGAGTDASAAPVRSAVLLSTLPIGLLFAYRVLAGRRSGAFPRAARDVTA